MRHGQSVCNIEHRMQEQYDSPLSPLGRGQAEACASFLGDWHFDAAYASDLSRAYETAQRIAARHPGLEIAKDPAFRELYAGKWQYMLPSEITEKYPEDYAAWKEDSWNSRPTGGESMRELVARVRPAAWRVAQEHAGQTVLIVTHYAPINVLQCEWLGMPYERLNKTPRVKNAGVYVADYDTESMTATPVVLGETSFLDNIGQTEGYAEVV